MDFCYILWLRQRINVKPLKSVSKCDHEVKLPKRDVTERGRLHFSIISLTWLCIHVEGYSKDSPLITSNKNSKTATSPLSLSLIRSRQRRPKPHQLRSLSANQIWTHITRKILENLLCVPSVSYNPYWLNWSNCVRCDLGGQREIDEQPQVPNIRPPSGVARSSEWCSHG